jgi:putative PIN family toxin of toxin-antitoxin system
MAEKQTPPIVLDTNVLVAGACRRTGSLAYRVLLGVLHGQVPLVLTPSIALEYQDVLLRPRVLALTGLSPAQALDLVTDLIGLARRVNARFQWRPNLRDESDNKFVDAAVEGAAIIVTYNAADFRDSDVPRYGWAAMTPQEFLSRYPIEEAG